MSNKSYYLTEIEKREKRLKEDPTLSMFERLEVKDDILDLKKQAGLITCSLNDSESDQDCINCSG